MCRLNTGYYSSEPQNFTKLHYFPRNKFHKTTRNSRNSQIISYSTEKIKAERMNEAAAVKKFCILIA